MATGQDLLNTMELVNQELQLQAGQADVARALVALNRSQDFFESLLAVRKEVMGDQVGTVTTTNNVESTAFPSGVLRVDRLQYIDPENNRPKWDLIPLHETGDHVHRGTWPYYLVGTVSGGKPTSYYTNGRLIYWNPLPDGTHTVRWYGFQAASDITAGGTFAYDDIAILPVAGFAAKLMKMGIEDDSGDVNQLAMETFGPVLKAMSLFRRDRPAGFDYRDVHGT